MKHMKTATSRRLRWPRRSRSAPPALPTCRASLMRDRAALPGLQLGRPLCRRQSGLPVGLGDQQRRQSERHHGRRSRVATTGSSAQFVVGAETDLQVSDADDMFAAWQFSNPWFGTLRGRAGYAMNNVMLYATFGLAYGGGTDPDRRPQESNTHLGWAAGAGMEVGLDPQLVRQGGVPVRRSVGPALRAVRQHRGLNRASCAWG